MLKKQPIAMIANYSARSRQDALTLVLHEDIGQGYKRLKNNRGQPCNKSRGWHGLKGACERVKKGADLEAAGKKSRQNLAAKIRKEKGVGGKVKPHEMTPWEWAEKYRPGKVATIKRGQLSSGTGGKPVIPTTGRIYDEHREIVEKALGKGLSVPGEVLSRHPGLKRKREAEKPKQSSSEWRSGKGRTALSLNKSTSVWIDGKPSGMVGKPIKGTVEAVSQYLKKSGPKEVDATFDTKYAGKKGLEAFTKRVKDIGEKSGYTVQPPVGRVVNGFDFPGQYVVTLSRDDAIGIFK